MNVAQSVSVVDVYYVQILSTQAVVADAVDKFQHFPLAPVNVLQVS